MRHPLRELDIAGPDPAEPGERRASKKNEYFENENFERPSSSRSGTAAIP
jgi:hypothetical protein